MSILQLLVFGSRFKQGYAAGIPTTIAASPLLGSDGGFVGGLYGAETALVVAAAGFLVQAVVILVSPALRLARQPRMAA